MLSSVDGPCAASVKLVGGADLSGCGHLSGCSQPKLFGPRFALAASPISSSSHRFLTESRDKTAPPTKSTIIAFAYRRRQLTTSGAHLLHRCRANSFVNAWLIEPKPSLSAASNVGSSVRTS